MGIPSETFYHETIKKIIVAFGSLFKDVQIQRKDELGNIIKTIDVPISYGQKSKLYTLLNRNSNIDRKVSDFLPRLAFEINGMTPDRERQKDPTLTDDLSVSGIDVSSLFEPVTYDFNFSLDVISNYSSDLFQIVEQILAYFVPDRYRKIKYITINDQTLIKKVQILLNDVNLDIDNDLDENSYRLCRAELDLTVKGFLFKPIKDFKLIERAEVDLTDSRTEKLWTTLITEIDDQDNITHSEIDNT